MKPHLLKRMTIATRLLWAFLVMALVPLSVVTYLIYTTSEQSLRAEVTNNLRAIADSKANQTDTYARERQRNVTALARMPSIVNSFEPLDQAFHDHGIGSPEYTAAEHELRPFLSDYLAQSGYADIVLLSAVRRCHLLGQTGRRSRLQLLHGAGQGHRAGQGL